MERKPHSTGSIVGASVLLVVVLLGLYVGGYFALGKRSLCQVNARSATMRMYSYHRIAYVYRPLARLEGTITGTEVVLAGPTKAYLPDGNVAEFP